MKECFRIFLESILDLFRRTMVYYFISDLHIGGDEALGSCDFEAELIKFMGDIAVKNEDAELIIVGDAFGLWEFTSLEGLKKFDKLVEQFPRIFDAFKKLGQKIKITVLPGNHDYELACYPQFIKSLSEYNINLEQTPSIIRELNGKRIWIEHGSQYDEANKSPKYGDPYALPIGYFITSNLVGAAGQLSQRGRYNWLKDVQSVYPTEMIPDWVISNYFYKEMSPILRWVALPFLLLSGLTLFVLGGALLEYLGLTDSNVFLNNFIFDSLGFFGNAFQIILIVNAAIFLLFIGLAIPISFLVRDFKSTLERFKIEIDPSELTCEKEDLYFDAARKVFQEDAKVASFIYGHTHKPSLDMKEEKCVINTGTWLKQFDRMPPRFGFLPPIYVPKFCLNYFRLSADKQNIIIDYIKVDKDPVSELSFIQKIMVSKKKIKTQKPIPEKTVI